MGYKWTTTQNEKIINGCLIGIILSHCNGCA